LHNTLTHVSFSLKIGMGEGRGEASVTNEIEDEEQVCFELFMPKRDETKRLTFSMRCKASWVERRRTKQGTPTVLNMFSCANS